MPGKGPEAARKRMYQSDTEKSIIVMCNRVENKLYWLEAKKKKA
jgi:hypothetical protein